MGIHDVDATQLIHKAAEELKKDATIKPPAWAPFVKTGMSKERAPVQGDWWFIRSASILRKVFILGPIGTSKLRTKYGSRKNRGVRPDRFYIGSGNIIRKVLQQLEKAGLTKQANKEGHKGRIITPKGHQLLERSASELMKEHGIVLPVTPKGAVLDIKDEKPKKKAVRKRKTAKKKVAKEEKVEAPKAEEKKVETPKEEEKTVEKVEAPKEEKKVVEKVETPEKKETPEVKDGKQ